MNINFETIYIVSFEMIALNVVAQFTNKRAKT